MNYRDVQEVAKKVHSLLPQYIDNSSTEKSIADKAEQLLKSLGITGTWYHDVPALVLLGSRSCLSVSSKEYIPGEEKVGFFNLVTVDLSPLHGSIWGDCARSYVVEDGKVTTSPKYTLFIEGLDVLTQLHQEMLKFIHPDTKYSELYEFANNLLEEYRYDNLDFLKNLGHSIEKNLSDRCFIDKDCHEILGSSLFFTFEPHIRKKGDTWGFKHEEIYYFDQTGSPVVL